MDAELKQYLIEMEGRLASDLDSIKTPLNLVRTLVSNLAESVHREIGELAESVTREIGELSDSMTREIGEVKTYVDERCEKVETNLLTEFHKWASPAEARNRTISAALRAIDLEMEALDDRLKKIEGRPPQ